MGQDREDYADRDLPPAPHWFDSPKEWAILTLLLTGIVACAGVPILIGFLNRFFG